MANINADINAAARKWGVSPTVLRRLLNQESGMREGARSGAGAQDIAQFMPATAKAYHVTLGDNNPTDDIFGAAHYLHDNLAKTGGSYAKALSIYNSGRPDAYKDPGFAGGQTYNYVKAILGGTNPTAAPGGGGTQTTTTKTIPGVDNSGARKALILNFIQNRHVPGAVVGLATGLQDNQDVPGRTVKTTTTNSAADTSAKGVSTFEGKPVAAWIKPLLQQARANGWKGSVTSGYRSVAEQARIYNSGQRPAAKPGQSNHNFTGFPGGAVDVTDPQGLARALPKGSPLKPAGAKDPPHFSVPRHGTY